ncbi:MAG: DUF3160 domain-containing protein [Lachnospiraceae bacterium]|nr:DUF3160 domain-containing protein [Lachnospiraceae bacterium]
MKKKAIISLLTALALTATACGSAAPAADPGTDVRTEETAVSSEAPSSEVAAAASSETEAASGTAVSSSGEDVLKARPALIKSEDIYSESFDITPCVPEYKAESDFSNVINAEDFSSISKEAKDCIVKNGFAIDRSYSEGREFYEVYEFNRYSQTPNFVTTDSMLHTYHMYYMHLMKNVEKDKLFDVVSDLSEKMLTESAAQYEALKGTEWEGAAQRNTAFFAVASSLLENGAEVPSYVSDTVSAEVSKIEKAGGIDDSLITETSEDYSQYKPRGYYDTDENLKKYFKAMMWYGRTAFMQKSEDLDRSALLMTLAMKGDAASEWNAIYAVTSFFAGASDDAGICEYRDVIEKAYGQIPEVSDLSGNKDAFDKFHSLTGEMDPPAINSVVFDDDHGATDKAAESKGFRFMGQRFTLDSAIFQQLIYSKTKENDAGETRNLPDVLDVPAAFGSDNALSILDAKGDTGYQNYKENMDTLKKNISSLPAAFWTNSLYSGWLNMLRPLLEEKGEGYPVFMQNEAWNTKSLETFCGSFTELKHDTVLYSKQVMAEMGGGPEDEVDDRGYVEPEPLVFSRLEALVKATAEGLDSYSLLSDTDRENLKNLQELSASLKEISIKELKNELLTDDEYELIRSYGGSIEHLWQEAMKGTKKDTDSEFYFPEEYPAALAVDLATDPNGSVLEAAIGNPLGVYVLVSVDGKLRIARGSVYDFYEFSWPISERLTDEDWRSGMGFIWSGEDNVEKLGIERPSWVTDAKLEFYPRDNY